MTRPGRLQRSRGLLLGATISIASLSGMACTGRVMDGPSRTGGPGGSDETGGTGATGGRGGTGGSGGSGSTGGTVGGENSAGPAVFRRLTQMEFQNTVRDLLGESLSVDDADLPNDGGTDVGFGTGAKFTNSVDALRFSVVVDKLVGGALTHLATLVPSSCNLMATAAADQETCAKAFIDRFGLRAFRRPLLATEQAALLALYKGLRADTAVTLSDAIGGLISGILQSPQFLYHWELADAPEKDGVLVKYGHYEMASRLSYFLWASMPDDTLFMAAAANQLNDPKNIQAQARRMLAHKNMRDGIADFHVQWLEIAGLPGLTKDESYTKYNAAVGQAMIDETIAFANNVLWGEKATGKLQDLFTSRASFVNGGLADLYGVPGITGDKMMPAMLDAKQRAGVLTLGGFLASHADGDFSHPVRRGVTMLRHILCRDMPAPDGLFVPTLPPRPMNVTTRQHYAKHSTFGAICSSCHDAIDPMGFAFEHYDAVGAYRETEVGQQVDASGVIKLDSGDLAFKDAIEMTGKLAQTPELRSCVARHWFRYLLRRQETVKEKGSVDDVMKAFEQSNWDVREMLVALTTTRAFTHRQPFQGEQTR